MTTLPNLKSSKKLKTLALLTSLGIIITLIAFSYPQNPNSRSIPSKKTQIRAAIVPHHLVAQHQIKKVLTNVVAHQPELILLITPNHFGKGSKQLVLTDTEIGSNQTASILIAKLNATGIAELNNEAVKNEHAIRDTVMLIRQLDKNIPILSLMVNPYIATSDLDELIEIVATTMNKSTLIPVYSIDFSHGLFPKEALEHDHETLRLIELKEYSRLLRLDSTYLDAPAVLITALKTAERVGLKYQLEWHSDAVTVTNSPIDRTVSYLIFGFY